MRSAELAGPGGSVRGVGIDVACTSRFTRLLERGSARVWTHWFTPDEARACRAAARPDAEATTRFAVKEATYKAIGADFAAELRWRDIEAVRVGRGWRVLLHGEMASAARAAGVESLHVSTSGADDRVLAMVVAQGAARDETYEDFPPRHGAGGDTRGEPA